VTVSTDTNDAGITTTTTTTTTTTAATVADHGPVTDWATDFDHADPAAVRDRIEREAKFDPDFWVLSLEMRGDDPGVTMARG